MDPLDASARWSSWSATGTAEQIAQMLDHLDARLPAGWRRLPDDEATKYRGAGGRPGRWYKLASSSDSVDVVAGLRQWSDTVVRGDWLIWLTDPDHRPSNEVVVGTWSRVLKLLDDAIGPAARSVRADFRAPTVEELFLDGLPYETRNRLQQFSASAHKTLSFSREEAERWREFVVSTYRMGARYDDREFIGWLTTQGWEPATAEELMRKLVQDVQLLELYRGEEFGR